MAASLNLPLLDFQEISNRFLFYMFLKLCCHGCLLRSYLIGTVAAQVGPRGLCGSQYYTDETSLSGRAYVFSN
jgi:hypothetical protein